MTAQAARGRVVPGATGKTYKIRASDKGKSITLRVTASSKRLKDRAITTLPSPKVGSSFGIHDARTGATGSAPVLTGGSSVGSTLSALNLGTWSPSGIALKMQWQVNGRAVASATGGTYVIRLADVGKKITLKVTVANFAGEGYPSTSKVSKSIKATRGTVSIGDCYMDLPNGTTVGKTVSVVDGYWYAGTARVAYTRQWLRNGKPIAGATKNRYKLTAADKGKKIEVKVTGPARGYKPASQLVQQSFIVR